MLPDALGSGVRTAWKTDALEFHFGTCHYVVDVVFGAADVVTASRLKSLIIVSPWYSANYCLQTFRFAFWNNLIYVPKHSSFRIWGHLRYYNFTWLESPICLKYFEYSGTNIIVSKEII